MLQETPEPLAFDHASNPSKTTSVCRMRIGVHLTNQPLRLGTALMDMNHPPKDIAGTFRQFRLMNRTFLLINPDMSKFVRENPVQQLCGQPSHCMDRYLPTNNPATPSMDAMPRQSMKAGMGALASGLQEPIQALPVHQLEGDFGDIYLETPRGQQIHHPSPMRQSLTGSAHRPAVAAQTLDPTIPQ